MIQNNIQLIIIFFISLIIFFMIFRKEKFNFYSIIIIIISTTLCLQQWGIKIKIKTWPYELDTPFFKHFNVFVETFMVFFIIVTLSIIFLKLIKILIIKKLFIKKIYFNEKKILFIKFTILVFLIVSQWIYVNSKINRIMEYDYPIEYEINNIDISNNLAFLSENLYFEIKKICSTSDYKLDYINITYNNKNNQFSIIDLSFYSKDKKLTIMYNFMKNKKYKFIFNKLNTPDTDDLISQDKIKNLDKSFERIETIVGKKGLIEKKNFFIDKNGENF